MARYTLATGEPIFTGFMRTPPGARFWGWSYSLLHLVQVAWPGWALAAGSALAALCLGRMPRADDHPVVLALGHLVFLGSIGIVLLSERVQRRVERAELIMMGWTVAFLLTVALMLVPWPTWTRIAGGFVSPLLGAAAFPADADWLLLAAFAAYSGAGGIINATLTHWLRDKGFGMAGALGSVPVVIGRQRILLAREGAIFEPTAANLAKWREWWRYLRADLCWLWMAGCLVGMGLPALLALEFLPRSAPMRGDAAGAVLAGALGKQHAVLWVPALVTAFWILFSTQLGVAAGFVRSVTDVVWTSGAGDGRRRAGGHLLRRARRVQRGGALRLHAGGAARPHPDRREPRRRQLRRPRLSHALGQPDPPAPRAAATPLAAGGAPGLWLLLRGPCVGRARGSLPDPRALRPLSGADLSWSRSSAVCEVPVLEPRRS